MRRTLTGIMVAAAVLGGACADADGDDAETVPAGPQGGAFYVPPDPLPDGAPGELIRAQPLESPPGSRAWRILYHSRTADDQDIAVSGVVVAPDDDTVPDGGRPVVSFTHGTTGLGDPCAPSKSDTYVDTLAQIGGFVDDGYVVVATDYQGLGPPGRHPYLVGAGEGRNALDAARAAHDLEATGAGNRAVVYGHSQGGHAALFAGEIAPDYAPDIDLVGVAAGAPVTDLLALAPRADEPQDTAGFLVMGALGFEVAYPDVDAADLLTPEAMDASDVVDEQCIVGILDTYAEFDGSVLASDPSTRAAWDGLVEANAPGQTATDAPILVFTGDDDELIRKRVVDDFVGRSCALGNTVEYDIYPGEDHGGSFAASERDVATWTAARFAGEPARSDC